MKVRLSLFALTLGAVIAWPQGASAQVTIASDSFELADHPTGDRSVVTGGVNGLRFFTRNAAIPDLYSASIVDDSAPGGLGSFVLKHDDDTTSSGGNQIIGLLPQSLTLASPGDFIRLEFTFRFEQIGLANPAGFRFGIEGSNGSSVSADGQTTASDNDSGYYAQTGVGIGAPANNNTLYRETGGTSPILGGTDRAVITTNTAGEDFNDLLAHTASFTITRGTGTNMSFSLSYDGGTAITGTTNSTPLYTFDEIAFGNGFVNNPTDFIIDNVSVVTNVPEPAALTLALLAVPFVTARRRRA